MNKGASITEFAGSMMQYERRETPANTVHLKQIDTLLSKDFEDSGLNRKLESAFFF